MKRCLFQVYYDANLPHLSMSLMHQAGILNEKESIFTAFSELFRTTATMSTVVFQFYARG